MSEDGTKRSLGSYNTSSASDMQQAARVSVGGNGAESMSPTGAGGLKNLSGSPFDKGALDSRAETGGYRGEQSSIWQRTYEKMSNGNIVEKLSAGMVAGFGELWGAFAGDADYYGGKINPITGEHITPLDVKFTKVSAVMNLAFPSSRVAKVTGEAWASREVLQFLRDGVASTHVYVGTRGGVEVYVGITNNLARRQAEHSGRFVIQELSGLMTRGQARAIEQAMINRNPGFENIRNSISSKKIYYRGATDWGEDWLQNNGF